MLIELQKKHVEKLEKKIEELYLKGLDQDSNQKLAEMEKLIKQQVEEENEELLNRLDEVYRNTESQLNQAKQ